jgi:hypothetical protein
LKIDQVPQDEENFYAGHRRAVYAKSEDGTYVQAPTKGWEVETYFTSQALEALGEEYQQVLAQAKAGKLSPLAVHMTAKMMTPKLLAEHAGFFTFQVKRHLRPEIFAKLPEKKLMRYAQCLNLSLTELTQLPEAQETLKG